MTKTERAKLILAAECFMEDEPSQFDKAALSVFKGGFNAGMELLADVLIVDKRQRNRRKKAT